MLAKKKVFRGGQLVEINVDAGENVGGIFDFGKSLVGAFKWPLAPRAAPTWSSLR